MQQSSTVRILSTVGVAWPGAVLVALIASAAFEPMRDFVSSLTILKHLVLWFAALVPGIVMVFVAERMRG